MSPLVPRGCRARGGLACSGVVNIASHTGLPPAREACFGCIRAKHIAAGGGRPGRNPGKRAAVCTLPEPARSAPAGASRPAALIWDSVSCRPVLDQNMFIEQALPATVGTGLSAAGPRARPTLPITPGREAAGVIDEIGPGVAERWLAGSWSPTSARPAAATPNSRSPRRSPSMRYRRHRMPTRSTLLDEAPVVDLAREKRLGVVGDVISSLSLHVRGQAFTFCSSPGVGSW